MPPSVSAGSSAGGPRGGLRERERSSAAASPASRSSRPRSSSPFPSMAGLGTYSRVQRMQLMNSCGGRARAAPSRSELLGECTWYLGQSVNGRGPVLCFYVNIQPCARGKYFFFPIIRSVNEQTGSPSFLPACLAGIACEPFTAQALPGGFSMFLFPTAYGRARPPL